MRSTSQERAQSREVLRRRENPVPLPVRYGCARNSERLRDAPLRDLALDPNRVQVAAQHRQRIRALPSEPHCVRVSRHRCSHF